MEHSLLAIFDEIPCTVIIFTVQGISYIAHDLWPNFLATLEIHKRSKFDWNELKISVRCKNKYMHQKKNFKWRILS